LERFLQLYADDNLQVLYPSTPGSYFHGLRRQLKRDFRKPLIVMTPKSLLRHKRCSSTFAEMVTGSSFHRVMYEHAPSKKDQKIERVVLCSGKIFYDLQDARAEQSLDERIALIRLEQLAPFPSEALAEELLRYKNSVSLIWCQEEPRNMGAWSFVAPRLEAVYSELGFDQSRAIFAGRKAAPSPATGSHEQHVREQKKLIDEALTL
jgi:2-oxoglutarate dehydrogenase E1 component